MNTCQLSGNLLVTPVISKKTGLVFEKDLIINHIQSTGQCPVTGGDINIDDLIEIQSNTNMSMPIKASNTGDMTGILSRMQSEWDELVLENVRVRKELKSIKEEMTYNLYQHEAAKLVICRLIKEKEDAFNILNFYREKLEEVKLCVNLNLFR